VGPAGDIPGAAGGGIAESRLNRTERDELLDIFLSVCRWTRIYYGWRPNLPDEADNHLVELAVAGSARAIVTRSTGA
jgi:predicted nucleic acid-binding protein